MSKAIDTLMRLSGELGLGYTEIATLANVSPTTVRHVLTTRKLPGRLDPRRKIEACAVLNEHAASRRDLRLV